MSEQNQAEGLAHFATADDDTRLWFIDQWSMWPRRADQRKTTNISFLYGGVLAYRARYKTDPAMSDDFRSHVDWHDKHPA